MPLEETLFKHADASTAEPGDMLEVTFSCEREDVLPAGSGQFVQKNCKYTITCEPGPVTLSFTGCGGQLGSVQNQVIRGIHKAKPLIQVLLGDNYLAGNGMSRSPAITDEDRKIIQIFYKKPYHGEDDDKILLPETPVFCALGNHELGYCKHGLKRMSDELGSPISYPSGDKNRTYAAIRAQKTCQLVTEEPTCLSGKCLGLKKFHQPAGYYKIRIIMSNAVDDSSFIEIFILNSSDFMTDEDQKKWFKAAYNESKATHKIIACHHAFLTPGSRTFSFERKKYDHAYPIPTNVHNEMLNWAIKNIQLGEAICCAAHDHYGALMDTESSVKKHKITQAIMTGGSTNKPKAFSAFSFLRYLQHGAKTYGATCLEFNSNTNPQDLCIALMAYLAKETKELAKFSYVKEDGLYKAKPANPLWVTKQLVDKANAQIFLQALCMIVQTGNWKLLKWILLWNFAADIEMKFDDGEEYTEEMQQQSLEESGSSEQDIVAKEQAEERDSLEQDVVAHNRIAQGFSIFTKAQVKAQEEQAIYAASQRDPLVIESLLKQADESFSHFSVSNLEVKKKIFSTFHETLTQTMLTRFLRPGIQVTSLFNQLGMLEFVLKIYEKLCLDAVPYDAQDDDQAAALIKSLDEICDLSLSDLFGNKTKIDDLPSMGESCKRKMLTAQVFKYAKEAIQDEMVNFDEFSETERIIVAELLCLLQDSTLCHPEYVLKSLFMAAGKNGNLDRLWGKIKGELADNITCDLLFSPEIFLEDLGAARLGEKLYRKIVTIREIISKGGDLANIHFTDEESKNLRSIYTEFLIDYIANQPYFPSLLLTESVAEKIMAGKDSTYKSIYTELNGVLNKECGHTLHFTPPKSWLQRVLS
jgi:hypothetical protein